MLKLAEETLGIIPDRQDDQQKQQKQQKQEQNPTDPVKDAT